MQVQADDTGRYGLRLRRIRLGTDGDPVAGGNGNRTRQDELILGLSTRVATPYGPFACVERDDDRAHAVLRTHQIGESACYYEAVVMRGNDVEVFHYSLPVESRGREETPVDLGMDMFRVMLVDLVDVVDGSERVRR